jgi:8-oxo-dGTP pyrophosphatase MutT (NUDIX family)
MERFYQIARLIEGCTIFPEAGRLRIDLDGVMPQDLIENDVSFQEAIAPQSWFWLSGGGSLLLNGHYLLVVRRSPGARVNPGKFSLFAGRADNAQERAEPPLLVRELFEELLLFEDDTLLVPQLADLQPVIDTAYDAMHQAGILADGPGRPLPLTQVPLPTRPVRIRRQGIEREHQLSWTAGPTNDINALFLFAADCDLARLSARDGEFHAAHGTVTRAGRDIYLLDLNGGTASPLWSAGVLCKPERNDMTPVLQHVVDGLFGAGGAWRTQ